MRKIRVLVVDDSALVRQLLTAILESDKAIDVVGTAVDPYEAREQIKKLNPDVLTLDVEMPRMDGITFLRNLMRLRPMPVVMVSSLTEKGADITLEALELGAVDFVAKPKIDIANALADYADEILCKVKMAVSVRRQMLERYPTPETCTSLPSMQPSGGDRGCRQTPVKVTDRIIAMGASTGGTEAVKDILRVLPADAPATLITQHIPEAFAVPFAHRLDRVSAMTVDVAQDGQPVLPGHVYIAPGNCHLQLARHGACYRCQLYDGPPVNRHRPSVDVMFDSLVSHAGANVVGVLLTGMGADGARGLKEMHDVGAVTVVQDEKTSVVWGMPGQAVKLGAADQILPLDKIAAAIMALACR